MILLLSDKDGGQEFTSGFRGHPSVSRPRVPSPDSDVLMRCPQDTGSFTIPGWVTVGGGEGRKGGNDFLFKWRIFCFASYWILNLIHHSPMLERSIKMAAKSIYFKISRVIKMLHLAAYSPGH